MTYKTVWRSIMNYAAPVWSTNIRYTNYRNIQYKLCYSYSMAYSNLTRPMANSLIGFKSWPDETHKQTLTTRTCSSLRCNHTYNTHWVHLKCTQIKQRQYKPDWRCTIHTPTQLVTTTPSTANTTAHHQQITSQLTHKQQSTKG